MPMNSRATRIIQDAHYWRRLVEVLGIYCRYPKAIPFKTYGLISNKLNRLGERVHNRRQFTVRHFGEDLFEFLRAAGFAVTCWDHTGRNDRKGDYFFLCEESAAKSRVNVA